MFFRRKRRNKRDPVLDAQNIPPNDVRERRGSRRGSIVGRIWRSMRIKRRAPLPDVRQPEVFNQPRPRASDPNPPSIPNNNEIIHRRDDTTLDKILSSRMKSYNVSPGVSNPGIGPTVTRVSPSAEEITVSRIRRHQITNNETSEPNQPRLPLVNPERRRSASADRNRRHEENRIHHHLRESQRGSSNIERPRSHDYEGQRPNNRLLVPINSRSNQERPVSDSRLLERYFRQHESRSRALQPNDRNSRSRSAEASSVACRQPLPLICLAETSEREPERDNHEQRIFYQSREHRISNNYRNNNSQRENIYMHIPNTYETTNEPAERIYEGIRELRVTNGISREQQNDTNIFQENRGNFHRNLNETRDLRIAAREFRTPVSNSNDYRIFAQSIRDYNPIEINRDNSRAVDLPREYRPVAELAHEIGEIHDSLSTFNQHNNVFYHENLRPEPPPYDEAINRQYSTTTLRSRPPSYSHVVEEIMNERLMMSSNVYSVRNPPRLRHNTPLEIRS